MYNSHPSSHTKNPATAHMRIFVGNINTNEIGRGMLQSIFCKYGIIIGISIHRGFAFVEFNNVQSARRAAECENKTYIGAQMADVNIAAEPKPHHKSSDESVGNYSANSPMQNNHKNNQQSNNNKNRNFNKVASGRVAKNNNNLNRNTKKLASTAKVTSLKVSAVVNLRDIKKELLQIRERVDNLINVIEDSNDMAVQFESVHNGNGNSSSAIKEEIQEDAKEEIEEESEMVESLSLEEQKDMSEEVVAEMVKEEIIE